MTQVTEVGMHSEIIELTERLIQERPRRTIDVGDFLVKIRDETVEISRRGEPFALISTTDRVLKCRTDFASPRTVRNVLWSIA